MVNRYSTATTALAFLIACNHATVSDSVDPGVTPPDTEVGTTTGSDPGPGADPAADPGTVPDSGPAVTCPFGSASFAVAVGMVTAAQPNDLAIDSAGSALFATKGDNGRLDGLTKLSASGDVLFTRPFGSVVATDRDGNAYIAGSFTQPIDLGLGVMTPEGNIDVFVAKLDSNGKVVFARQLALCGDGVQSIAVDAAGRIAVSGTAMGTALLSPEGEVESLIAVAGDVAFNAHGDLIIAGTFTTTIDLGDGPISPGAAVSEGFVATFDSAGQRLWSHVITGSGVHVTSVAVDSKDAIVLVGYTAGTIDLFGEQFTAQYSGETGRVTGAFAAKLDASGALIWKDGTAGGVERNGVAVDASDNVFSAGAEAGNAGNGRIPLLSNTNPMGEAGIGGLSSPLFMGSGGRYGRGESVAVDSCGSVYMTFNLLDTSSPASPLRAYVVKLQP